MSKPDKKTTKEPSNGNSRIFLGYSLVSKGSTKNISELYLETGGIILILCHLADFDRTPRPSQAIYIYKINSCRSTFTQFKKSKDGIKKTRGRGIFPPPS